MVRTETPRSIRTLVVYPDAALCRQFRRARAGSGVSVSVCARAVVCGGVLGFLKGVHVDLHICCVFLFFFVSFIFLVVHFIAFVVFLFLCLACLLFFENYHHTPHENQGGVGAVGNDETHDYRMVAFLRWPISALSVLIVYVQLHAKFCCPSVCIKQSLHNSIQYQQHEKRAL